MSKFLFFDNQIINVLRKSEKPSGGSAVQTFGWIRGLIAEKQDVVVMTELKNAGEIKESCRDIRLVPFYDRNKGIRWIRWIYYRIPHIYRTIKRERPDYVYQGVPEWTTFVLGVICKMLGIKFVVRISNDFIVDDRILKKFSKSYRFLQDKGIGMAHCVLCQNEYQYNTIRARFPLKKVIKIANPVYEKYKGEILPAGDRKYIAWIGIFQYQKNLRLLFDIAQALPERQFVVAGKEDPKCDSETFEYLKKLQVLPNVRFVGFLGRQAVLDCVAKAAYLLNTSHYEGFSNTFLEAMCSGTPIISSDKVNPDSIISENSLGFIYSDVHELVTKLSQTGPEAYAVLSENNFNYVQQHHDYRVLAKKLIAILEEKNYSEQFDRTLHKVQRPLATTPSLSKISQS